MIYLRNILYSIVLILFLEVIKTIITKMDLPWSYFVGTMVAGFQFLVCLLLVLSFIISKLLHKYLKGRKGALMFVGIAIVLIAFMECLAVYWLNHAQSIPGSLDKAYRYYYTQYDRNIVQYDASLATYDPSLFYKLKPGISGQFSNAEFDTKIDANSLGLRDDDPSLHKPAVICLGDSYAMGWGVQQREAFPAQLETMSGMKVLNGAMSSFGTVREMIRLRMLDTTALKYLVIQYCINDFDENDQFLQHSRRLPISSHAAYDSLVQMQHWNAHYFPGKVFLTIGQIFLKMQINKLHPFFSLKDGQHDIPDSKLQAAKFLEVLNGPGIDLQKVKVIVVFVDDYVFRDSTFPEEVELLAQQQAYKQKFAAGLRIINMYKHLSEQDYYHLDSHIRFSGHKKTAEKLWEVIKPQ